MIWKLHYRDHDSSGKTKRVWRDDWSGDQFEVLKELSFEELKRFCSRFAIVLQEHDD